MTDNYLGEIRVFSSGSTQFIPSGWLPCEGQLLPVANYQALFSLLGKKFGGDGKTNFALPDLRGRVPVCVQPASGLYGVTGASGGADSVALGLTQVPAHIHPVAALSATPTPQAIPGGNYIGPASQYAAPPEAIYGPPSTPAVPLHSSSVAFSEGNAPHENRQPFIALRFYIATTGLYPVHT